MPRSGPVRYSPMVARASPRACPGRAGPARGRAGARSGRRAVGPARGRAGPRVRRCARSRGAGRRHAVGPARGRAGPRVRRRARSRGAGRRHAGAAGARSGRPPRQAARAVARRRSAPRRCGSFHRANETGLPGAVARLSAAARFTGRTKQGSRVLLAAFRPRLLSPGERNGAPGGRSAVNRSPGETRPRAAARSDTDSCMR